MTKLRIGLIGLGMAVTPHALSLKALAGRVEVRAFSRSPARRAAFHERFGLPVVESLDEAIEDVDAVMLLTPPDARLDLVRRIAAARRPLLMEKPLERTLDAALEIVRLTEEAGIATGVVFQQRFREGALRLRAVLAEGGLGEIATAHLDVPWWRQQSYYDEPGRGSFARDGGGVLITQAIHVMDLMLSFTGPVAAVQAIAGTSAMHAMESEDFVAAGLLFASGALGGLMATTALRPGFAERLVLGGTQATAVLDGGRLTLHHADGRVEEEGTAGTLGGTADPMAFSHVWHQAVITDFLDALQEGRSPRISAREALMVHRLIDALLRSAREGRRVTLDG